MHSLVLQYLVWWRPLGYVIAFFGMMIEGDGLLFAAAFLIHRRYFDFGDMFSVVFLGNMVGDLLWYWLGSHLSSRFVFFSRWADRLAKPFDGHLVKRQLRTLLFSKFTFGVHRAILLRAGSLHLQLKNFIKNDFIASLAWILAIGSLGFLSSAALAFVRHYLRYVEGSLVLALVLFYFFFYIISQQSKKEL